ncbi:MAG: 30S ribosomal protein S15 [Bacilli bacterium]
MALEKAEIAKIVKEFGENEHDTGSTKVQVAIITKRIQELTTHLKANIHDYSSKRALFVLVGQRRGLLSYLDNKDHAAYLELIKKLGIRKY